MLISASMAATLPRGKHSPLNAPCFRSIQILAPLGKPCTAATAVWPASCIAACNLLVRMGATITSARFFAGLRLVAVARFAAGLLIVATVYCPVLLVVV